MRSAPLLDHDHHPVLGIPELSQCEPRMRRKLTRPELTDTAEQLVPRSTLDLDDPVIDVHQPELPMLLRQPTKITLVQTVLTITSKAPLHPLDIDPQPVIDVLPGLEDRSVAHPCSMTPRRVKRA